MVTIGSLRYDVVADTSKFTRGMVAARSELSAGNKAFRETRTPTEALSAAMAKLSGAYKKGAIDTETYSRAVRRLKSDHSIAQGGIRGTIEQMRSLPAVARNAVTGFVAYRTAGMAAGQIGDAFNLAADLETTIMSFEVLTGSAAQAAGLVEQLRQYDAQTTFSFADTTQAAQKLMNFGVATEDVVSTLRALGDISMGDAEKLSRLSLAFGQTTSMGRLMGGEVRQMVEAGFNPLQEISRTTGESMAVLQKRMEDGGVSSQELAAAIASATEEGGRFFGMVEKRSQSTAGQIDLLRGEWDMLKADMATTALPAVQAGVGTLRTSLAGIRGDEENSSGSWWQKQFLEGISWQNMGFDRVPVIGGDPTGRDHQAMRVVPSTSTAELAKGETKADAEKQHKEAQDMRAKQVMATEEQTNKTQELIDAQPTPVS